LRPVVGGRRPDGRGRFGSVAFKMRGFPNGDVVGRVWDEKDGRSLRNEGLERVRFFLG
jgi:hypothetical protein